MVMDEDKLDRNEKKQNRIRNRKMKEYRHIYKGKKSDTHKTHNEFIINTSKDKVEKKDRQKKTPRQSNSNTRWCSYHT